MCLTLNDVDGEGLGGPLHSVDLGRTDIVRVEAGVEAVDENTTVSVNCKVHSRRYSGAVVHAEAEVRGCGVGQQAGQQVVLTFFLHHPQGSAAGPEYTDWICRKEMERRFLCGIRISPQMNLTSNHSQHNPEF